MEPFVAGSAAACCAAFYEQDWVRTLMGDHFHPGGEALTQRLFDDLALQPGDRVLDLACGTGTTAGLLAERYDVEVVGLDFSAANVDRARGRAPDVHFEVGSADALPFPDQAFDAVICECAVSTFERKPAVASQVARVLKDGGHFAMSDMCVYRALPEDLAAFGRGWSCVDDALTLEGYRDLMRMAGLTPVIVEDETQALHDLVFQLKKRLLLIGLSQAGDAASGLSRLPDDLDLPTLRTLLERAKAHVTAGDVRYGRLVARRGSPRPEGPSARRSTACDPSTGCC